MSSKILEKYKELKVKDYKKIYIFKAGNFYIAINEDTKIISDIFNYKVTNFGSYSKKCGFPITVKEKCEKILQNNNINYEIIENYTASNISDDLIKYISSLNIDDKSITEKEDILRDIISRAKTIINIY